LTSEVANLHSIVSSLSTLWSSNEGSVEDLARQFVERLSSANLAENLHLCWGPGGHSTEIGSPLDESVAKFPLAVGTSSSTWIEESPNTYWVSTCDSVRLVLSWPSPVPLPKRDTVSALEAFLGFCLHSLEQRVQRPPIDLLSLAAILAKATDIDHLLETVLQTVLHVSVAKAGTIRLLHDREHRDFRLGDFQAGQQALLYPIYVQDSGVEDGLGNSVCAQVELFYEDGLPPSVRQMQTLQAFISQIGLAFTNALHREQEREEAREAQLLYKAARTIEEGHDLDEVLSYCAEALAELADVQRSLILLNPEGTVDFNVVAATGISDDQKEFFSQFRFQLDQLSDGLQAQLRDGRAVHYTPDGQCEEGLNRLCQLLPGKGCLLVPLLNKDKIIGLIYLDDQGQLITSERTTRLVLTLSVQISNAIQKASLVQQLQENLGPLKALYQVGTAITATLSLSKVVKLIVEQAVELLDHSACALLVLDELGDDFRLETSVGLSGRLLEPEIHAQLARVAVDSKRATTLYLDRDPECAPFRQVLEDGELGGLLSVPLIARKKMVGVLNCFVPPQFRFRQQEIRFLKGFANQAAIAVENARLHGLVRFKMGELGTLFEVTKAVTSTLQLDKVLQSIVQHVIEILRADAASLMLVEGERLFMKSSAGLDGKTRTKPIPLGEGVSGLTASTGQAMLLLDQDNAELFPANLRSQGFKTILCVPIETRGKVIGVINTYFREYMHQSPAQINLLTTLGGQAAVAIENARLYAEKERVTELLRGALISSNIKDVKLIEVGDRFLPSMDLSGDYYDVIPRGEGEIFLSIADVSGKGPDAAIHTVQIKVALRCFVTAGYGPADCLKLLNLQLSRETNTRFATLFCACIYPRQKTLRYACAGHEPPVFWDSKTQTAQFLTADGLLLGAMEDSVYEEKMMQYSPESILLLYTDGITEARNAQGEFFGTDRVLESVEKNSAATPQKLVDTIYARVRKFARDQTSDDLSLLAVRI
jgi:sigma-B regulation protein RsbU (phosphoserine phosphatase)